MYRKSLQDAIAGQGFAREKLTKDVHPSRMQ
jgi:hypothetical protein